MTSLAELETELETNLAQQTLLRARADELQQKIFKLRQAQYPQVWLVQLKTRVDFPLNVSTYTTYAICTSFERAQALSKTTSSPTRIVIGTLTDQHQVLDSVLPN